MEILFLFILIGINAFFAASEIALISLNDNKIKIMAESGNKKAEQLLKLLGEPSRFLATIQIGITLAGFLASAFAAESFADPLVNFFFQKGVPLSDSVLRVSTVIIITILLAYFTLVLGELVPKRIAMKKFEGIAFFVVIPLTFLSKITAPFVKLLTISTNFFVRLFGVDPDSSEDNITEEEIRMMIDVGEEKGTIHEYEKVMINNIFEFNNKTAEDIMTHRMEIKGLSVDSDLKEIIELVKDDKYSRIPVYEDTIDNIIGILNVKDLLQLIGCEKTAKEFSLEKYIRKPIFVPTQKRTDELFVELQNAKNHMAIVIDEYGGTAGIITLEDLIEEIVGNIFDEYDEEEDIEIKKLSSNYFEAAGITSLGELEIALGVELPVEEYETINGLIIGILGRIPDEEEKIKINYNNLEIEVVEASEKRIEKVFIRVNE